MQNDRPSTTAWRVAMRRAVHQLADPPPVLNDPLAVRILGENLVRVEMENASRIHHPAARVFRAFMAVRSRYAEDRLASAVQQGTRQYVVLGAGLDTFAFRNPHPGLMVYEIDHPATQLMKRHRLEAAGISIPDSVVFVPVNFESESLMDGLSRSDFRFDQPVLFSWLGVVPYLTESVVMETFRLVAGMTGGCEIVFDFAIPPSSLGIIERMAYNSLARRVAAAGEPFRTWFDPDELRERLREIGFERFEILASREINERYFQDRPDGLRARGSIGRLMSASRGASA